MFRSFGQNSPFGRCAIHQLGYLGVTYNWHNAGVAPHMAGQNHDEPVRLPDDAEEDELLAMLDVATRAVREHPKGAMRHCNRAFLLLRLGRKKEALDAADGAVRAEPGSADAHIVRGIALCSLGRTVEALWEFERAIGLDPANADAQNNRASMLMALGGSRGGRAPGGHGWPWTWSWGSAAGPAPRYGLNGKVPSAPAMSRLDAFTCPNCGIPLVRDVDVQAYSCKRCGHSRSYEYYMHRRIMP